MKPLQLLRVKLAENILSIVVKLSHRTFAKVFTGKCQFLEARQLRYFVDVLKVLNLIGR